MTTLNKDNINEIAQVIADIVDTQYDKAHGLRIINSNHDNFDIKEGDWVEHSHDWDFENDISSDDMLDGCSTVGLTEHDDAEYIAEKIIDMDKSYGYGLNSKLVLVSGKDMGYGDDDNEVLIDGFATKVYTIDLV